MSKKNNSSSRFNLYKRKYIITGVTFLSFLFMFQYKYNEVLLAYGDSNFSQSNKLFWTRLIFGRTRSRFTGKLMRIKMNTLYSTYILNYISKVMNINKDEIKYPIESFKSISEFFSRRIKEETRPIEDISPYSVACPADSEIVEMGELTSEYIDNIKGLKFNVNTFLGSNCEKKYKDGTTKLYYAIFYLSPRKYHHFHAPFNFNYSIRRHISGELFPIFQGMFKFINNIFNINERVVLAGEWEGGNMYYVAVSAYNVGDIKILKDSELHTNNPKVRPSNMGGDIEVKMYKDPKNFDIGEEVGEFKMGSSIVLIFENKNSFLWDVNQKQSLLVGQRVGGAGIRVKPENLYIRYTNDKEN